MKNINFDRFILKKQMKTLMKNLRTILIAAAMVCCTMISLKAQDKITKATPAQIANDKKELKKMKDILRLKETPSGLVYLATFYVKPTGPKPAKYTKVKIQYSLMTADRKLRIHDWGGQKGLIVETQVDKLPYGLQECIKMMDIGSEYSFYLIPKLAKSKYEDIGKGRTLTGNIKLVSAN